MKNGRDLEKEIVDNLGSLHAGKWVNHMIAIWTVANENGAFTALNNLVLDGVVERKYIGNLPHFRYIPPPKPDLKVVE